MEHSGRPGWPVSGLLGGRVAQRLIAMPMLAGFRLRRDAQRKFVVAVANAENPEDV
jgi:hypothetical protein